MAGFQPYLDANRNTRNPIIHISLNPHPDDVLSREQYCNLAVDYMERMGYGDQPYVVFLHEDIDPEFRSLYRRKKKRGRKLH